MSSATPAATKTSTSPIFWQVMPMAPPCIWSLPMAGILWVLMCGRLPMPCLERCACTRRILSSMMPRSMVTAGVSRSPMALMRRPSARRVAATRHAGVERALVVRAHAGAYGRALSRVAADRPADGAEGRAAHGALEHAALRRLRLAELLRRRRRRRHARIRGIESRLLDGPRVALALVRFLLLRALAPGGIEVCLGRRRRWSRRRGRRE